MLREKGSPFTQCQIVAGEAMKEIAPDHIRVAKAWLCHNLARNIEQGRLRISDNCFDAKELRDQLFNFEVVVQPSGNVAFAARSSAHDDLVMALALANLGTEIKQVTVLSSDHCRGADSPWCFSAANS